MQCSMQVCTVRAFDCRAVGLHITAFIKLQCTWSWNLSLYKMKCMHWSQPRLRLTSQSTAKCAQALSLPCVALRHWAGWCSKMKWNPGWHPTPLHSTISCSAMHWALHWALSSEPLDCNSIRCDAPKHSLTSECIFLSTMHPLCTVQ